MTAQVVRGFAIVRDFLLEPSATLCEKAPDREKEHPPWAKRSRCNNKEILIMKRKKTLRHRGSAPFLHEPALNVVVYRNPGPDDNAIEAHARSIVAARSPCGTRGGLGYITFVESDFDRLWNGVDRGDAYGTAYSVLPFLGPTAEQFIGRAHDFIFGWIGGEDAQYGNVLLLQIIPQPHLLAVMN